MKNETRPWILWLGIGSLVLLFVIGVACNGWEGHVHADGCGHYYWHDAWYDAPHPGGCTACVVPAPHSHGPGCGHHYWHNTWYDYAHPANCGVCVAAHSHGPGCGHHYWHGGWWARPHPPGCCNR